MRPLRVWQKRAPMRGDKGVTLIELLVALVIGSLLIIGAVSVYLQSRNTYRTNETVARLQEVGRYSLDMLESDVRLAGYWGLTNRADFVENSGTPAQTRQAVDAAVGSNCGVNFTVDASASIDARDATSTGGTGWNFGCAAVNPVSWADVLVVRRASSDTTALQAGRMQVQSTRVRAVYFNDGALPALFDAASSETHDVLVHAYYVSDVPATANTPRQFVLRRKTLIRGGANPVISDEDVMPGVEDLQVQFGIDVAPRDGNVDRYVNPGAVPAGARITSARIWLRVLAEDREIGFNDDTNWAYANAAYGVVGGDRRRVLISKTIQIRNAPL